MSGHTPGPWEADENDSQEQCVVGGDHTIVCYMSGLGPQTDADKKLIVAAPDLLAALQAFVDANDNGPANEWVQRMTACDKKAREAIAKATP